MFFRFLIWLIQRWVKPTGKRYLETLRDNIEGILIEGWQNVWRMRGHLLGQLFTSRLPQRLQFVTSIGHKTGDIPPVLGNDIGIIYAPRGPIVVGVFTNENRGDFFVVESAIGNIARDLFEAWGK